MVKKIGSKIMIGLYIIFIGMIFSGCWDNKDIVNRSFASCVALDRAENGEIEVTLQLLKPNVIKAKQQGGSDESAIWVLTTTGDTVFEALRNQLRTLNRKPFYSHLRLIIIGEELAREGLRDVLDLFIRHNEVRIIPKILVAKNMRAKDIMDAQSEIENIPALHLEGILENNIAEAKTRDIRLIDVLQELTAPHGSTVIGNIVPKKKGNITKIKDLEIEGAAVIHGDKVMEFLDANQTRGYLFLKNEVKGGGIIVNNPGDENKKISINIKNAQGKIKVNKDNNILELSAHIKMKGDLWEEQGSVNLATQKMLERIEEEVEKEIIKNIQDTLKVAQEQCKCDFIGFGNAIAAKYPQYWESIKENWNEEFIDIPVHIEADVEIINTGIITKPIDVK